MRVTPCISSTCCATIASPPSGCRIPPPAICGRSSRTACAFPHPHHGEKWPARHRLNYRLARGSKLLRQVLPLCRSSMLRQLCDRLSYHLGSKKEIGDPIAS